MSSAALRWLLAGALAAGLVFVAAALFRGRRLRLPPALTAAERLAGSPLPAPAEPLPRLAVAGTSPVGRTPQSRATGRGLAHCLEEEGRPAGVLAPLDLRGLLPAPAGGPPGEARPERQPVPAPSREEAAAVLRRAADAAREVLPAGPAPRPRRVPPPAAAPEAAPALRPPPQPPRDGDRPLTALPGFRAEPESAPAGPVAPPKPPERLPAPAVPLD